jgi:hypothetical protein
MGHHLRLLRRVPGRRRWTRVTGQVVGVIPVDQDRFGPVEGNCFSACVASILDLNLVDVPRFMDDGERWLNTFFTWLAARGLQPDYYGHPDWCTAEGAPSRCHPQGYSIMSGWSPRHANTLHAVVALNGVMVHDPNPSRAGIVGGAIDYITIVPAGTPEAAAAYWPWR